MDEEKNLLKSILLYKDRVYARKNGDGIVYS